MSYAANPRVTDVAPPKNENPGVVTSDSLAGESIKSGGSFAANSDARGVMDQPSSSTNTNNTDISGATTLDAAPNADARDAQEAWSESSRLKAGEHLGSETGSGNSSGSGGSTVFTTSGGSGGFASVGIDDKNGPSSSGGSSDESGSGSTGGVSQPKGDDLEEGGFSSEDPNSSFDTDIGGKNDPGRAALGSMQASDASSAGGAGPRQGEVTNDGQFDALGETDA